MLNVPIIIYSIALNSLLVLSSIAENQTQPRFFPFLCLKFGCHELFSRCVNDGCVDLQCERCFKGDAMCAPCLTEFNDPSNYVTIGSNNYLLCDPSDQLQQAACKFHCQRQFKFGSTCLSFSGYPICACF